MLELPAFCECSAEFESEHCPGPGNGEAERCRGCRRPLLRGNEFEPGDSELADEPELASGASSPALMIACVGSCTVTGC